MGTLGQTIEKIVDSIRQECVHLSQTLANYGGFSREDEYVLASNFQKTILAESLDLLLQGLEDSVIHIVDNAVKQL